MSPFKSRPLTCLLALLVASGSCAQDSKDAAVTRAPIQSNGLEQTLDAYLAQQSAAGQFSGVVLVARNGVPVFRRAYGYADRANKRPNNVMTRFDLGSLGKLLTQSAVEQLVAEGKLSYSQTLGSVLPDFPQAMSLPATVQQLLNMTAGLNDLYGPEFAQTAKDGFRSNADYYTFLGTLPSLFPPCNTEQHCNGCFIVLGEMIERLSQEPYEQYMTENIYKPTGMVSTASLQADGIQPNVAIGYTQAVGNALENNIFLQGASGSAAGGAHSTVDDLLAYLNDSRSGRLPPIPRLLMASGASPGVNTFIQTDNTWMVIVLANLDPPAADQAGADIFNVLTTSQ